MRFISILTLLLFTWDAAAQPLFYHCNDSLSKSNFIYDVKKVEDGYIYIANDRGLLASDGKSSWYVFEKENVFPREIIFNDGLNIRLNSGDTVLVVKNAKQAIAPNNLSSVAFTSDSVTIQANQIKQAIRAEPFEQFNDFAAANGWVWIASNRNFYLHQQNSNQTTALTLGNNHQLSGVNCIEQIGNNLWIGTNGYGLYHLNLNNYFIRISDSESLIPATVSGDTVFAFNEKAVYTLKTGSPIAETKLLLRQKGILGISVFQNKVYVVLQQALLVYNKKGLLLKNIPLKNFAANGSLAFFRSSIYLGSNAQGVLAIDSDLNYSIYNTTNGLLHNQVMGFAQSSNRLLAYSKKGGISDVVNRDYYIDYQTNALQGNIKHVALVNREWWVSTEGFGIKVFDESLKLKATIDQSTVLNSPYVLSILTEDRFIYGVQPRSLFAIKGNQSRKINPADVLSDVYFSGDAVYSNKALTLGSNKGLLLYQLSDKPTSFGLKILTTLINGYDYRGNVPVGANNNVLIKLDAIIASPTHRELDLRYTLSGTRESAGAMRSKEILLPNLPFGNYTLNIYGAQDKLLLTHKFNIAKVFFLRTSFWLMVALVLAALVYGVIRWRTHALNLQNLELEAKITERTKRIQEKSKLLEQISFTLSHDLKTPAYNLIELSKMLRKRLPDADKFATMFEDAGSQILLKTLNTLEALRSDSSSAMARENVKLRELIKSAIRPLDFQINKKEAHINIDIPEDAELTLNRGQWQSVFFNLVSNALKYSKPSTTPVISLTYKKVNEHIIEIIDNGIGIDLEKTNVFGKFNSGDTETNTSTGVGLSLVKQIVELHNGSIRVKSKLGEGSTFIIRLAL